MINLSIITNSSAQVILSLAVMLFAGFLVTRITKLLKLPNVTGYILAGVLIGPYVLNLISADMIKSMDFITDVALAFIAFGVGKYFRFSELKASGSKIFILTVFESLVAAALITLSMIFIFHLSVPFSLLLGAIGSATAPASTIMTIKQYRAKGEFVNTILQVVALDDAVALIAFSICAAVAEAMENGGAGISASVILIPILTNILTIGFGAFCGYLLHRCIDKKRSDYHRLVLVTAILLALTGLCTALNISPLLSCMVMGMVYINISHSKQIFKQVDNFTPSILLLFFVLSGMRLNIPALKTAGIIGISYFFIRIVGKCLGAWLGSSIGGFSKPIRKYVGLALIPQAGVSIGLAVLGQRILPADTGTMLSTIILSSGVLYEMVGPACAKASLFLSKSIPADVPANAADGAVSANGANGLNALNGANVTDGMNGANDPNGVNGVTDRPGAASAAARQAEAADAVISAQSARTAGPDSIAASHALNSMTGASRGSGAADTNDRTASDSGNPGASDTVPEDSGGVRCCELDEEESYSADTAVRRTGKSHAHAY